MRNRIKIILGATVVAAFVLFTSAFTGAVAPTDACGVFALGDQKIDLSAGETTLQLTKAELLSAIKSGVSFSGTADCQSLYDILGLSLVIYTDKEDVIYTYDLDMMRQMQSMEDFMLERFFIDAKTLVFKDVVVENAGRGRMGLPEVSYTLN